MLLSELEYNLPSELIAQRPAKPRDSARLLIVNRKTGEIREDIFRNISNYLDPGDVIVLNDTKVIRARLFGRKEKTGGKVEILLLKQVSSTTWEALVKPSSRVPVGTKIVITNKIVAEVLDFLGNGKRLVIFSVSDLLRHLNKIGEVPLPPYIKRQHSTPEDIVRYQTIYSKKPGSVAAPTAGLHYTNRVFQSLRKRGIDVCFITLHVGYGTFKLISTERVEEHKLDPEEFSISKDVADLLNKKRSEGRRIVAVGTTVTRVLETQFKEGKFYPGSGYTDKYIYVPYEFKAIDALQTNFHLPRSTLLALVYAFGGVELIRKAYNYAIQHNFRFYSYGDTMLIL
ncbi:MAG: tRNA preQ1(34) S-adenosylmethionine ribosyltransferase-isomerase QueA [Candidatus Hydrogenedentes bacterium]|nr:tRNA preQ1(34) S-adenosylmethionine ribosyltransferase-isomerase QueA [Candidatus Hydrogenedentota bacterium]